MDFERFRRVFGDFTPPGAALSGNSDRRSLEGSVAAANFLPEARVDDSPAGVLARGLVLTRADRPLRNGPTFPEPIMEFLPRRGTRSDHPSIHALLLSHTHRAVKD